MHVKKGCVGQTKQQVKQGMAEHRSATGRKDVTAPAAVHLMGANHSVSSVSARAGDLERRLPQREACWTHELNTRFPLWS